MKSQIILITVAVVAVALSVAAAMYIGSRWQAGKDQVVIDELNLQVGLRDTIVIDSSQTIVIVDSIKVRALEHRIKILRQIVQGATKDTIIELDTLIQNIIDMPCNKEIEFDTIKTFDNLKIGIHGNINCADEIVRLNIGSNYTPTICRQKNIKLFFGSGYYRQDVLFSLGGGYKSFSGMAMTDGKHFGGMLYYNVRF